MHIGLNIGHKLTNMDFFVKNKLLNFLWDASEHCIGTGRFLQISQNIEVKLACHEKVTGTEMPMA